MHEIKDLIASQRYTVGDRIPTENELAARFGVGRTSIREALKIFHYLGVLESRTGRGTFVRDRASINTEALTWSILLGQNNIYELLGLREALEESGLKALMRSSSEEPARFRDSVEDLERRFDDIRRAVDQSSIDRLIDADYSFHQLIIAQSRNQLFSEMYLTLKAFMREEVRRIVVQIEGSRVVEYHRVMLEAIRGKDTAKALESLSLHIDVIRKYLRE